MLSIPWIVVRGLRALKVNWLRLGSDSVAALSR